MGVPVVDMRILDIGMQDLGEEEDLERCLALIDRMETLGLVQFRGQVCNGVVLYRMDICDKEVAKIIVALREGDDEIASIPLHFRAFSCAKSMYLESCSISSACRHASRDNPHQSSLSGSRARQCSSCRFS